ENRSARVGRRTVAAPPGRAGKAGAIFHAGPDSNKTRLAARWPWPTGAGNALWSQSPPRPAESSRLPSVDPGRQTHPRPPDTSFATDRSGTGHLASGPGPPVGHAPAPHT